MIRVCNLKKSFGDNEVLKGVDYEIHQGEKTAQGMVNSLWEPLFNFIDENQNVFTGNVANEIEKYNLMMFNVGSALRKESHGGSFDVKG